MYAITINQCRRGVSVLTTALLLSLTATGAHPSTLAQEPVETASPGQTSPDDNSLPASSTDTTEPAAPAEAAPPEPAPDSVPVLDETTLDVYRQQLAALEEVSSTYDPNVGETLAGMGRVLLQLGHHEEAIESYQRAMHIQRVNNGIYSLAQEPMLRGLVNAYQAVGDMSNASIAFQHLYGIYTTSLSADDPQLVDFLREKSHWHLLAYNRNPARSALEHLIHAQQLLVQGIAAALKNHHIATASLVSMWRGLATTNYYIADHNRNYPIGEQPDFTFTSGPRLHDLRRDDSAQMAIKSYSNGRIALQEVINTLYDSGEADKEELARAIADLGDWDLLFGRQRTASASYKAAWDTLAETPEKRAALFAQPQLITMGPGPDAYRTRSEDNSYVVARFTVTPDGKPDDAEIIEMFPPDDDGLARTGLKSVRSLRFRPQLANGEAVASSDIIYRVNLSH